MNEKERILNEEILLYTIKLQYCSEASERPFLLDLNWICEKSCCLKATIWHLELIKYTKAWKRIFLEYFLESKVKMS